MNNETQHIDLHNWLRFIVGTGFVVLGFFMVLVGVLAWGTLW